MDNGIPGAGSDQTTAAATSPTALDLDITPKPDMSEADQAKGPHHSTSEASTTEAGRASPDHVLDESKIRELTDSMASLARQFLPELYIGITRPIGTDTTKIVKRIKTRLTTASYLVVELKMSELIQAELRQVAHNQPPVKLKKGMQAKLELMTQGDTLRYLLGNDALALLTIRSITQGRSSAQQFASQRGHAGVAYLITNLMHREEVARFRSVYRQRFFLIGAHQDYGVRRDSIVSDLRKSGMAIEDAKNLADRLMEIDQGQASTHKSVDDFGLSIDETFHQADLFVSASSKLEDTTERLIYRLFDQIFGNPFGVPSRSEMAMAYAYKAAQSSAALARPVGAAIVDTVGDLSAVGWNDPPKPEGGQYRVEMVGNRLDYTIGYDAGDLYRIEAIAELIGALVSTDEWLDSISQIPNVDGKRAMQILAELLSPRNGDLDEQTRGDTQNGKIGLSETDIMHIARTMPTLREFSATRSLNLIEFGRPLHAEVSSILMAGRLGRTTKGATLYVTTFPCHLCTGLIIGSGIQTVYYVEPYGKSLATTIYADEITTESGTPDLHNSHKVQFAPYLGISPKRFDELFSWVPRKWKLSQASELNDTPGRIVDWSPTSGTLRPSIRGYTDSDDVEVLHEATTLLTEQAAVSRLELAELRLTQTVR